jgi:chitin disaccharide deacetylase
VLDGRLFTAGTVSAACTVAAVPDGLLIVNADDWGLSQAATDAALACFRSGAVTSATGMVWMRDSERAAEIARAERLPIGLHLNLIEPYDAPTVPPDVAERQRRICDRMAAERTAALLYDPRWRREFERCIADQLTCFEELYGHVPTHVDGHRHQHLALNAVFARPLRAVPRYRRSFSFVKSESPLPKRMLRALLMTTVRARFTTPDYLFSIRALVPELGGRGLAEKLALARSASVEVMVHPELDDERRVLASDGWRAALEPYTKGSFADLPA